ncbi:GP88 family protein [Candidatus Sororendozoicomonas aggregata]|uniref:GP88 family protein n=1 Tax=Candidatus Sororendozoicomonas aggregata TaxID=3073239 RepID=UPI002ED55D11
MIHLSRVSKLDGIRSWSMTAGVTCPGSRNFDGSLVDACAGCYAKGGNYRFSNARQPREENQKDWKRSDWVADMVRELDNDRYFRWFDSGDIYHPELAKKILEIVRLTPWAKHWIPTRSHKLPKLRLILEKIAEEPNASVRYSSDSVTGEYGYIHGSTIVPTKDIDDANLTICEAYANNGGRCNGCRKCWDKSIKVIAYIAHGRSMRAVLKRKGILIK